MFLYQIPVQKKLKRLLYQKTKNLTDGMFKKTETQMLLLNTKTVKEKLFVLLNLLIHMLKRNI